MAPAQIALPRLQLQSRQGDLSIVIEGSLLLDVPSAELTKLVDFEKLYDAVTQRQLWINRVGPCVLRFSTHVDGTLIDDDRVDILSDMIRKHEVRFQCYVWMLNNVG